MPTLNKVVLKALFDSYLNVRKHTWGANPPTDKTEVVKDCLQKIENMNATPTTQDWQDLVNAFCDKAVIEAGKVRRGILSWFTDYPLLLETITAALSYIVSKNENLDRQKYDDILKDVSRLVSYNAGGANAFHDFYFMQITKTRDPEALMLKESSFLQFEANVLGGERTLTAANKLLGLEDLKATAEEKSTPTSTAAINATMSPVAVPAIERSPTPEPQVNKTITTNTTTPPKITIPPRPTTYADMAGQPVIQHPYETRSSVNNRNMKWQQQKVAGNDAQADQPLLPKKKPKRKHYRP